MKGVLTVFRDSHVPQHSVVLHDLAPESHLYFSRISAIPLLLFFSLPFSFFKHFIIIRTKVRRCKPENSAGPCALRLTD